MSQTRESPTKCVNTEPIEDSLNFLKNIIDMLSNTHNDLKSDFKKVSDFQQNSNAYQRTIKNVVKKMKDACTKASENVKVLNNKVASLSVRLESCGVKENGSDKEINGRNSSPTCLLNVTENNLMSAKENDFSDPGNSMHSSFERDLNKQTEKESINKLINNDLKNKKDDNATNDKISRVDNKNNETYKSVQIDGNSVNINKEADLKINSNKDLGDEDDSPKTKIRLVAIEKLLDPKIRSSKYTALEHVNRSVIILDSDEDDTPLKLNKKVKVKDNKIEEISKTKIQKIFDKENKKDKIKIRLQKNFDSDKDDTPLKSNKKVKEKEKKIDEISKTKMQNCEETYKCTQNINKEKEKRLIVRVRRNKIIEDLYKLKQTAYDCKKIGESTERESKKDNREMENVTLSESSGKDEIMVENMKEKENEMKEDKTKNIFSRNNKSKEKSMSSDNTSDECSSNSNELPIQNEIESSDSDDSSQDSSVSESVNAVKNIPGTINDKENELISEEMDRAANRCISTKPDNLEDTTLESKNSDNSSDEEKSEIAKIPDSSTESEEDEIIKKGNEASKESSKQSDKNDSSDSDVLRRRKKKRIKRTSDKSSNANSSDEDESTENKKKSSKRKRIRTADSNSSNSDNDSPNKKRKNIRKLIKTADLLTDTKRAAKEEEIRRKRIEERQRLYNKIYEKPENVELDKLVLDFNEETNEELLKVDPGILKKLKPHQAAGVKFMWDACFETIKDAKSKAGSGCILGHCMGLGKTLQVITLAHTLMINEKKTGVSRVLVITPLSTLTNWAREFYYWLRFSKKKDVEIYDMSKYREKNQRTYKIKEWFEEGGVCIIGYDMFRILSNPKAATIKKKMRDTLQTCLVDPGADLVVCDEGHLLKNEKTSLSKAVSRLRTQRRIVLTGTPLQNNLKEYYCMIQFIKPNLLGTYKEYMNRFVNPITNGQYTDSTARDIQLMKNRSHVLHKLLEGCIQRRDYSVLAPYLPPKHEYVVFITMSDLQKKLYEFYMTKQREIFSESASGKGKGSVLFMDFQNLRRIWTHPMSLRVNSDHAIKKKLAKDYSDSEGSLQDFIVNSSGSDETSSSDSDSTSSSSDTRPNQQGACVRRTRQNASRYNDEFVEEAKVEKTEDPTEWWMALCPESELTVLHHSPKLLLLMQILQECESIGDKVLLFSQSLQSLDVIEHFLSLINEKTQNNEISGDVGGFSGSWMLGIDYFRLDGSSSVESREYMCKSFNDAKNLRARLFLISTRAGGLGINLVSANRVIIFDVSWNPSHDTQSIFRVYRFGQNKPCYIYRFIAMGTMEEKVYERQVAKQATAKRVFDEQQIGRHYNQNDLLELYKYELEPTEPRQIPILPKDRLFADILSKYEKFIFKYHEHDSLLESEESENLNEEERKAAWAEYEAEKERPAQQNIAYNRQNYATNGPVTTNKIFGFRTDVLQRILSFFVIYLNHFIFLLIFFFFVNY